MASFFNRQYLHITKKLKKKKINMKKKKPADNIYAIGYENTIYEVECSVKQIEMYVNVGTSSSRVQ